MTREKESGMAERMEGPDRVLLCPHCLGRVSDRHRHRQHWHGGNFVKAVEYERVSAPSGEAVEALRDFTAAVAPIVGRLRLNDHPEADALYTAIKRARANLARLEGEKNG